MKFKILVKNKKDQWWEEYDKQINNPEECAKEMIKTYNETLYPGDLKRTLLKVEILENNNNEYHNWIKQTGGMSVEFRGNHCDLMYCKKCGITGKRFGLGSKIEIDSKYKKKAYQKCNTAIEEIRKNGDK